MSNVNDMLFGQFLFDIHWQLYEFKSITLTIMSVPRKLKYKGTIEMLLCDLQRMLWVLSYYDYEMHILIWVSEVKFDIGTVHH